MSKDYAKKGFAEKQSSKRKRKTEQQPTGMFFLLAALLLGGVCYMAWPYRENIALFTAHLLERHKTPLPAKTQLVKAPAEAPPENAIKFDFYTELPKMQVNTPIISDAQPSSAPLALPAKAASNVVAPDKRYRLELGVYADKASASQQRLSLLLAGVESEIVKSVSGNVTSYHIQVGPYATEALAKTHQKRLQKKGIDSVIKNAFN